MEQEQGSKEELYTDVKNTIERRDELDLALKDPTLKQALVGVGWDLKAIEGDPLDLDASLFLLDKNEKTRIDEDFIFYNNTKGCEGAVNHKGDNRTGAGDGDDEAIFIDLNGVPFDVVKIMFVVSIYDGEMRNQDFTMVRNVYFRMTNQDSGHEIFRYELDEKLGEGTALIVGEMERIGAKWVFRAIGENVVGGLAGIASNYGIVVAEQVQA